VTTGVETEKVSSLGGSKVFVFVPPYDRARWCIKRTGLLRGAGKPCRSGRGEFTETPFQALRLWKRFELNARGQQQSSQTGSANLQNTIMQFVIYFL
jgi:hypothetical protein